MSYLANLKGEFTALADALQREVKQCEEPSDLEAIFEEYKKQGWEWTQDRLKRSYWNGRDEATGAPAKGATTQPKKPGNRFAGIVPSERSTRSRR